MRTYALGIHFKRRFWSSLTILLALFGPFDLHAEPLCNDLVKRYALTPAQALKTIAKEKAYTEGLIFSGGYLYESQGLYGKSMLRRIDPYTGMAETVHTLDEKFFGEGLAELDHRFYQLTYKENSVFAYTTLGKIEPEKILAHVGEGWGLTQIDRQLVASDGSAGLTFMDPTTLQAQRKIQVHLGRIPIPMLNELESAHGLILANIFGADWVAMIHPQSGCIEGIIDLSRLRTSDLENESEAKCYASPCVKGDFAANGIAFDPANDELYFTGKNWPYIFVFKYPR